MCGCLGTCTVRRRALHGQRAAQAVVDEHQEVWGHCPRCDDWFVVEDPRLETLLLCPTDLARADATEVRLPV